MATKNTITAQEPTQRTLCDAQRALEHCRGKLLELAALFASINDASGDQFRVKPLATLGRHVASDWADMADQAVERIAEEIQQEAHAKAIRPSACGGVA